MLIIHKLVYCSECGSINTEDNKFCRSYGKTLSSTQVETPKEKPVPVSPPNTYVVKDEQKKSNLRRNVVIVLISIVIIFGAYSVLGNVYDTQNSGSQR